MAVAKEVWKKQPQKKLKQRGKKVITAVGVSGFIYK